MTDTAELWDWLARRNKALETMDLEYAAEMMPRALPEVRLMAMHKAAYECTAISRESRLRSAAWLRERGLGRATGDDLMAEGELPE